MKMAQFFIVWKLVIFYIYDIYRFRYLKNDTIPLSIILRGIVSETNDLNSDQNIEMFIFSKWENDSLNKQISIKDN